MKKVEISRTQGSVSYTHLDVYKRQVYRNLDILVEEGALRKVEVPDGPNRFDFILKI